MSNVISIEIINFALHQLGSDRINSLQEDNKRARLAKDLYNLTRDEVLSEGFWACCLLTKKLSLHGVDENIRKYKLPADFVRMKKANSDYTLDGEFVYSYSDNLEIQYVSNSVVTGKYSATLRRAIGYKLAMDMCFSITQSQELLERLAVLYQSTMDKGLGYSTVDSNEQVVEITSDINNVRHVGANVSPYRFEK